MKLLNASYINAGIIDKQTQWKWGKYKRIQMIGYIQQQTLIILNAENLRVFQDITFDNPIKSFSFSENGNLIIATNYYICLYKPEQTGTLFQPPNYVEYSRQNISVESVDFFNISNDDEHEYFLAVGNTLQIFEMKKRELSIIYSMQIMNQKHLSACIDGKHFCTWNDDKYVKVWRYIRETNRVVVQYIKTEGKVKSVEWRKNVTIDLHRRLHKETLCRKN